MSRLHALRYRLRALMRPSAVARDYEDELRFHMELEAMHQRHAGADADEAPFAARRRLGNTTQLHEEIRDMSARRGLEVFTQDVRYGFRSLTRAPGFTIIAVLTLALGIGATTAIFSVVNAVVLRPLPYPDADRITMVWMDNRWQGMAEDIHSWPNFADIRRENTVFTAMSAYVPTGYNFTGGCVEGECEPQRVTAAASTADLFTVLGTEPLLGRTYTEAEETEGSDAVVVLGHGLWTRYFNSATDVIGRTVRMSGRERVVVGVMPAGFAFPNPETELWVPLALPAQARESRNSFGFYVVGRLAPGVPIESARAAMNTRWSALGQEYPDALEGFGLNLVPLGDQVVGRTLRTALWIMLGAVGAVLLIGCVNVANLLLSRATVREREVSVRLALGASRRRLVKQLLTESLLLATLGGLLGVALASVGLRLLVGLAPAEIPRIETVTVDGVVLAVTLLVVAATGIVFGLAPALQASRADLASTLRAAGRDGAGTRHGNRTRQLLAGAQLSLVVVLLVGAGLLIRSFQEVRRVDLGFDRENLLTVRLALPGASYQDDLQRVAFFNEVVTRVNAIPMVQGAAATSSVFLSQTPRSTNISIEERTPAPGEANIEVPLDAITPEYFRVMATPLVRGRSFTEQDDADAPPVVIINQNMARRFWGEEDPIGKRMKYGSPGSESPWRTIVGVVSDMRRTGFDAPVRFETFLPVSQMADGAMTLVVRTAGDPAAVIPSVRAAVRAVDPDLPLYDVQTMDQQLAGMIAQRRFSMTLLGTFAVLALVLGIVGVYGVTSYLVAQRTREVGVRIALGAEPGQLVRLVVWQGMRVAMIGLAAGLVGAVVLGRMMEGLLYGVATVDLLTLAGVTVLLVLATLVANYVPARRAARVSPLVALRSD